MHLKAQQTHFQFREFMDLVAVEEHAVLFTPPLFIDSIYAPAVVLFKPTLAFDSLVR